MAGQRTLDPLIEVRILASEPPPLFIEHVFANVGGGEPVPLRRPVHGLGHEAPDDPGSGDGHADNSRCVWAAPG